MPTEFYSTNAVGQKMYLADWAVAEPRAVVCLVHGQSEHIRRYDAMAAFFNENRLAVVGFDQQGHGRTEGKRGHSKNVETLFDDIEICIETIKKLYPQKPIFLFGHSLGGQEILSFLLKRPLPKNMVGAIATSPWIALHFEPSSIKVFAARLLKKLWPTLTLANDLDASKISRDSKIVEIYKNDPFVHNKISAAAGVDLLENARFLNEFSGKMPIPTLLMHGSADEITSFEASEAFAKRVKNVDWKPWPHFFHETHNEPEKREVWKTSVAWIEKQL